MSFLKDESNDRVLQRINSLNDNMALGEMMLRLKNAVVQSGDVAEKQTRAMIILTVAIVGMTLALVWIEIVK